VDLHSGKLWGTGIGRTKYPKWGGTNKKRALKDHPPNQRNGGGLMWAFWGPVWEKRVENGKG